MSKEHDHYVTCDCGAHYSNTIEKCLACGKANPELAPTLNAKDAPGGKTDPEAAPSVDPHAPTLNAKDPT